MSSQNRHPAGTSEGKGGEFAPSADGKTNIPTAKQVKDIATLKKVIEEVDTETASIYENARLKFQEVVDEGAKKLNEATEELNEQLRLCDIDGIAQGYIKRTQAKLLLEQTVESANNSLNTFNTELERLKAVPRELLRQVEEGTLESSDDNEIDSSARLFPKR